MKNKKYLLTIILALVCQTKMYSLTNVSGSYMSDVTWTLANSPYHVTSNIFVFPGVTLTIDPGVNVIFDGYYFIEIRGKIVAKGTQVSKINFSGKMVISGNDSFYTLWDKILVERNNKGEGEFNHCIFKDANSAVASEYAVSNFDNCRFENNNHGILGLYGAYTKFSHVKNCIFEYNKTAVEKSIFVDFIGTEFSKNGTGIKAAEYSRISNCQFYKNINGIDMFDGSILKSNFTYNRTGLRAPSWSDMTTIDTLADCVISYNDTGIDDSSYYAGRTCLIIKNEINYNKIGFKVNYAGDITGTYRAVVKYNKICHNSIYNIVSLNNMNKNFTDNCFCTEDSGIVEGKIFDGYEDPKYGLITYNIYDSVCNKKKSNNFKRLQIEAKDTGCQIFATCINYSDIFRTDALNNKFSTYPNPVFSEINIHSEKALGGEIIVYNSQGQIVHRMKITEEGVFNVKIDTELWVPGIYILSIAEGTSIGSMKIIKN